MNVARSILIQVVLGVVLTALLVALWPLLLGNDPLSSLLQGVGVLLPCAALGIVVWLVMLILFRKRIAAASAGGRVGWSMLAALIGAVANLVVLSIIGLVVGGWAAFLILFVVIATGAFALAALIANLLTNLAIARPAAATESGNTGSAV